MKTLYRWTLAAGLAVTVGWAGAADEKKDAKAGDAATPQEIAALAQAHEAVGTVASVDASGKSLVFQIEYQKLEVNQNNNNRGGNNNSRNLMQQQQQIMRTQNPIQRAQLMQKMMQQAMRSQVQSQPNVKVVTEKAVFTLKGDDATKVRLQQLPPRTNSEGKPQPYTQKELAEFKGPLTNLPGYEADFASLSAGMTVKVTLGQAKGETLPVKFIMILPDAATPMTDPKKK